MFTHYNVQRLSVDVLRRLSYVKRFPLRTVWNLARGFSDGKPEAAKQWETAPAVLQPRVGTREM